MTSIMKTVCEVLGLVLVVLALMVIVPVWSSPSVSVGGRPTASVPHVTIPLGGIMGLDAEKYSPLGLTFNGRGLPVVFVAYSVKVEGGQECRYMGIQYKDENSDGTYEPAYIYEITR